MVFNEIIKQESLIENEELEKKELRFEATQLGLAILRSGLSPEEGLLVYQDLAAVNKRMILANELHQLYQLTPVTMCFQVQWAKYMQIYRRLTENSLVDKKICDLIGIDQEYIEACMHDNSSSRQEPRFNRSIVRLDKNGNTTLSA